MQKQHNTRSSSRARAFLGSKQPFVSHALLLHFREKSEHLLVQNKVEVKSTIAGRACTPAVLDLSRTAGHQGHHHDAHLHPEQDLPAAALRHHSELWWKHRPDSLAKVLRVSRQRRWSRSPPSLTADCCCQPCCAERSPRLWNAPLWISGTSHSRRCMWTEEE